MELGSLVKIEMVGSWNDRGHMVDMMVNKAGVATRWLDPKESMAKAKRPWYSWGKKYE